MTRPGRQDGPQPAPHHPSHPSPDQDGRTGPADPCATLLLLLCPIILIASAGPIRAIRASPPPPPTRSSVNPNSAPWYELTVLPRIGEGMAHRIVHYRESAPHSPSANATTPAFQKASDLLNVPGIGPVTLQRIGPLLSFDDH